MEAKRAARRRLPLLSILATDAWRPWTATASTASCCLYPTQVFRCRTFAKKTARHLCLLIGVFVAMGMSISVTEGADPLLVRVDGGLIRGRTKNGVDHFMGLPYAASPIGKPRWRDPQPVVSWRGIREASAVHSTRPLAVQRDGRSAYERRRPRGMRHSLWAGAPGRATAKVAVSSYWSARAR
jgi:hypothetical protein